MSTSWKYGNVSPSSYPNAGRKRKSDSVKGSNTARKKKKEKENEALVIQNMKPVGLKKNEVTCLGEMPSVDDPATAVEMTKKECHDYIPNPNNPHCREDMVEVVQEGVFYPQANEKETQEAVQELINELNGMVDQVTQTYPPQPTLEEAFNNSKVKLVRGVYDSPEDFAEAMNSERKVNPPPSKDENGGIKRLVRMATIFQSPAFQNPRPRARSVDYMVCPCHEVRLEERKSQKGWEYVKCPMYPCLLFCAKEKALDYMREVYRQPHPDVCDM